MELEESPDTNMTVSSEIDNIIRSLVANSDVSFKSQQRGEPEPTDFEKTKIATDSYQKNKANFLLKFGKYLEKRHLNYFNQFTDSNNEPADYEEIKIILDNLKSTFESKARSVQVKNRRYEALQQLVNDGSYFTEIEMMKRNPLLYEQLVGQYMTDDEKHERDKFEMKEDVTFVKILMEGIERDNAEFSKKMQQQTEDNQMEESDSDSDEDRPIEAVSCSLKSARPSTARWGEFEEHQMQATKSKKSVPMVTASERSLLRQEFISTMHQNFVDGKDGEFFDYTTVDDNPSYDNTAEMEHDAEEKYFNCEDPEERIVDENVESSEDELDIYMNALNQHPAVSELAEDIHDTL